MTVIVFDAPGPLMSMNNRDHWRIHAARTKEWKEAAQWAASRQLGLELFETAHPRCHVNVLLPVRSLKIRRDPHNYYPTIKAIVDGLVKAGVWPDDTPEYVITHEPNFTQGGQVAITLTPAEDVAA